MEGARRSGLMFGASAVAVSIAVGFGLYTDHLLILLGAVGAAILTMLGLWRPFIPLLVYVASIPFEDVLTMSGIGSVTRTLGLLFVFSYGSRYVKRLRFSVLPLSMWVYVGIAVLSLVWSLDMATAQRYLWVLLQQVLMCLLVANMVSEEPERLAPILWVYAISTSLTAFIALAQAIAAGSLSSMQRMQAFEGQSEAHFAAALLPALVFSTMQIARAKSRLVRVGMVGATTLMVLAVVASGTRSAWLGLLVALVTQLLPRMTWRQKAVLGVVIGVSYLGLSQLEWVADYVMSRSISAVESGGAGRLDIWRVGLRILQRVPLLGVGIGNFPRAFTEDAISSTSNIALFGSGLFAGLGAHNIYLGTAVELGLVGFAVFMAVIWYITRCPASSSGGITVRAAFIGYMVQGFFLDIVNRKFFWLVVALALGLLAHQSKQRKGCATEEQVA